MLKKNIRVLFSKKRKVYSDIFVKRNSELIKEKLLKNFDLNIKYLHTFIPIEEKKEVNTLSIINEMIKRNINVIVPVISVNSSLEHYYYDNNSKWGKNKYNIMEPQGALKCSDLEKINIILVPLLCFDLNGNRVGYGKGYYDRFLPKCRNGIKIGVSFEDPVEKIDDINKFDYRLDYCITPERVYDFIVKE
tara:strand:+ start:415 stop:987 length:573 start_codon:yes stop_codon:yes gene_type:complete